MALCTPEAVLVNEVQRPIIGTHDGAFHFDEITACIMLRWLPAYASASVVRSRKAEVLDECDVVVDCGGEYDFDKKRFDHHQRTFTETWSSSKTRTPLSSAGLVWRHFGKDILKMKFGVSSDDVDFFYEELYDIIFEAIDANDNGKVACKCDSKVYSGGLPDIAAQCGRCNTSWIDETKMSESEGFSRATEIARQSLEKTIQLICDHYLSAKREIEEALLNRRSVHPSGKLVQINKYHRYKVFFNRFEGSDSGEVSGIIWKEDDEWHCESVKKAWESRINRAEFSMHFQAENLEEVRKSHPEIRFWSQTHCVADSKEALFQAVEYLQRLP